MDPKAEFSVALFRIVVGTLCVMFLFLSSFAAFDSHWPQVAGYLLLAAACKQGGG